VQILRASESRRYAKGLIAMSKYGIISDKGTSDANYDISTEDIIKRLKQWDTLYNIEISDVGHDRLTVKFGSLPEDLESLSKDIYEFCPDVIPEFCTQISAMNTLQ